jgi:hypothetical protein
MTTVHIERVLTRFDFKPLDGNTQEENEAIKWAKKYAQDFDEGYFMSVGCPYLVLVGKTTQGEYGYILLRVKEIQSAHTHLSLTKDLEKILSSPTPLHINMTHISSGDTTSRIFLTGLQNYDILGSIYKVLEKHNLVKGPTE